METIQEHEDKFWKGLKVLTHEYLCGIACPKCGAELYMDSSIVRYWNGVYSCKACGFETRLKNR